MNFRLHDCALEKSCQSKLSAIQHLLLLFLFLSIALSRIAFVGGVEGGGNREEPYEVRLKATLPKHPTSFSILSAIIQ